MQLGEQRVVRAADDREVELGVRLGGVLPASIAHRRVPAVQQGRQLGRLGVSTLRRGQSSALHLQDPTDLDDLSQLRAVEAAQRPGDLAGGAYERAVALAHVQQAGMGERADGLPDGVAADSERGDQLRLRRDPLVHRPAAGDDRLPHLLDDLVHQAGPAGSGQRHSRILSRQTSHVWHLCGGDRHPGMHRVAHCGLHVRRCQPPVSRPQPDARQGRASRTGPSAS